MKHISVLLNETIDALNIKEDGVYVDCTLGYAGHSSAILRRLKKGKLFAFDQDDEARKFSENVLSKISNNFTIIPSNFVNLKDELIKRNINVDGIALRRLSYDKNDLQTQKEYLRELKLRHKYLNETRESIKKEKYQKKQRIPNQYKKNNQIKQLTLIILKHQHLMK